MSLVHNTGARLGAWVKAHALLLAAAALALGLVVTTFATTYRIYDERQARLTALQQATISFCEGGNELRAALRDYLRQTIVIRPVPPGSDADMRADIEERNQAAQAALDRGERVFAARDCVALTARLRNPR